MYGVHYKRLTRVLKIKDQQWFSLPSEYIKTLVENLLNKICSNFDERPRKLTLQR